jgi:hypothetical protein
MGMETLAQFEALASQVDLAGHLATFFGWISLPWVPWVMSGLIVAWALWHWVRFSQKMTGPFRSLRRARSVVEAAGTPSKFAGDYENIREKLDQDPVIGHSWREFTETLLLPESEGEQVRSTVRPGQYFNEQLLTSAGVNLSFYQAVPNLLVGIGLLFTFLGLVAALFFASQGVGADVDQAQRSLQQLLHAATFKFMTSIAGLGCSILFSSSKKILLHRFDDLLGEFCASLERCLHFVTPVSLADRSHRELQRQTTELQRFNTDLAISIAEALDQRMSESFRKVMEPMAEMLKDMTQNIGKMNEEALGDMLKGFTEKIDGAAGTHIKSLIDGLTNVQESLTGLIGGMENVTTGLNNAQVGLKSVVDELASTANGLHQASDPMIKAAAVLGESVTALKATSDGLTSVEGRVAILVAELKNSSDSVTNTWKEYRAHFSGLSGELEGVFREMGSGIDSYRENVEAFISKVDEHLASSVGKLGAVITELRDAIEDVRDVVPATGNGDARAQ